MIGYRRRLSGLYQGNSEEAGELRKGISLFFEHFRYIRRILFFLKSFSWILYKLESGQRKRKTSPAHFLVPNPAQFAIPHLPTTSQTRRPNELALVSLRVCGAVTLQPIRRRGRRGRSRSRARPRAAWGRGLGGEWKSERGRARRREPHE